MGSNRQARLDGIHLVNSPPAASVLFSGSLFREFISVKLWKTKCLKNLSERVKELAG